MLANRLFWLFSVSVIVVSFLARPQLAIGGMIMGQIGAPATGNGVAFVFNDTLATAHLELSGTVFANENPAVQFLLTADKFWQGTVNLSLDETQDDEIFLTVTLQHISQPHPGVDVGNGVGYASSFTILAEDYADTAGGGKHNVPKPMDFRAHTPHRDVFFNERFSFTKTTLNFPLPDQDEIPTWAYTLDARHESQPIPEPSTMLLFGTGFVSFLVYGRRWKPRA